VAALVFWYATAGSLDRQTDAALRRYNIEPGSPRALKLFAA